MIVKNERHVIERCLASVKGLISSWAIVDTGSEDGTQNTIRAYLKDIPGELIERPWKDFAHNRTEALAYVPDEADYILIVDADEEIKFDLGFEFPFLDQDGYYIQSRLPNMHYYRMQLVKNGLGWRWESKLHEYIISDQSLALKVLPGMYDLPHPDGFRSSNSNKYKQDALTLEQALLEEPDNARYLFYLAQSYRDCGDIELALRYYKERVLKEGWQEEVWYALYQIALLKAKKGDLWESVQMSLLDAYNFRPNRAEPLLAIIEYYRGKGAWPLAYFFANQAVQMPYPTDLLFVEPRAYGPQMWLEFAYSANGVGKWKQSISACNTILANRSCSPEITQQAIFIRLKAQEALFPEVKNPSNIQRKINILVECDKIDHLFDNCINSLLNQTYKALNITCVIKPENKNEIQARVKNLSAIKIHVGNLQSAILACEKNQYALILAGNSWLIRNDSLSIINQELNKRGLQFLHGQHLTSTGIYGNGFPLIETPFLGHLDVPIPFCSWIIFQPSTYKLNQKKWNTLNKSSLIALLLSFSNIHGPSFFIEKPLIVAKQNL